MFFDKQDALKTYMDQIVSADSQFDFSLLNYKSVTDDLKLKIDAIRKTCSIDKEYVKGKFEDVEKRTTSDILVLLDKKLLKPFRNQGYTAKSFQESVVGVLITQKGECAKYPDVHSLSLICTKPATPGAMVNKLPKDFAGVGTILLGAYLYMIKENGFNYADPKTQIGILDLASSMINVGGFCSYRKFDFKYDPTKKLYDHCYDEEDGLYANLPMVATITDTSQDEIIQLVNGTKKNTKGALCDNFKGKANEQLLYAFAESCLVALDAIKDNSNSKKTDEEIFQTLEEHIKKFNDSYTKAFNFVFKSNGKDFFTLKEVKERLAKLQEESVSQLMKDISKYMPAIPQVYSLKPTAVSTTIPITSRTRSAKIYKSFRPSRTRGGGKKSRRN